MIIRGQNKMGILLLSFKSNFLAFAVPESFLAYERQPASSSLGSYFRSNLCRGGERMEFVVVRAHFFKIMWLQGRAFYIELRSS